MSRQWFIFTRLLKGLYLSNNISSNSIQTVIKNWCLTRVKLIVFKRCSDFGLKQPTLDWWLAPNKWNRVCAHFYSENCQEQCQYFAHCACFNFPPIHYKMESLPFPLQKKWRAVISQLSATSDVGLLLNFLTIALWKIPSVETQILMNSQNFLPQSWTLIAKDMISHLSAQLPVSNLCSMSRAAQSLLLLLFTAQLLSDCCSPAPEQRGAIIPQLQSSEKLAPTPNSRAP